MVKKTIILAAIISLLIPVLCGCSAVKKPLDTKYEFSKYLKSVEESIKNEDWNSAKSNLENADKAWKKIKPILQLDIDHDYVNDIENNFITLSAYIDTKEKADGLAAIRLIQHDWENIDSM